MVGMAANCAMRPSHKCRFGSWYRLWYTSTMWLLDSDSMESWATRLSVGYSSTVFT
jgi:hypothetical protein